jgi:hypothetical protein
MRKFGTNLFLLTENKQVKYFFKQRNKMTNKQYHTIRTLNITVKRRCSGRDRMVVGFTITYVISAYHH